MRQDRYRQQAIGLLLATMLTVVGTGGTAAAAETRTIQLQNGTIYSGELVEWVPGDHVTLQLVTGEIRRIPWTDLAQQPPPPPVVPPPPGTPPEGYPPNVAPPNAFPPNAFPPNAAPGGTQPPGTLLTITTKNPHAQLTQISGGGYVLGYGFGRSYGYGASVEAWRTLCTTPCNQVVPSGGSYRIAGPGIVPSAPFTLSPGSAELRVKTGSLGAHIGGLFLTVIGASSVLTGGILVGIGRTFGPGTPFYDPGESAAFRGAGGAVLGVGLGSLVAGIALLATSGTKVQVVNNAGGSQNAVSLRLPSGRPLALSAQGLHF